MAIPSSEARQAWREFLASTTGAGKKHLRSDEADWQGFRGYVFELQLDDILIVATDADDPETGAELGRHGPRPDALWLPDPPDGRPGNRLRFVAERDLIGCFTLLDSIDVLPVPRRPSRVLPH
jgi:hypothetical protein